MVVKNLMFICGDKEKNVGTDFEKEGRRIKLCFIKLCFKRITSFAAEVYAT